MIMIVEDKWPADYPAHVELPPEEAEHMNLPLYRFVNKENPDLSDFLASYKDPEQKHLLSKNKNNPHFYATSFFNDLDKISSIADGNPEKFSKKKIYKGDVRHKHGKCSINNKSGHVSVWLYENIFPEGFESI
jgi:hypothetical protein